MNKFVEQTALAYLERVLALDKHQDVLHNITTGWIWEQFIDDCTQHAMNYDKLGYGTEAIGMYVAERTRAYVETFLNFLHSRVGAQAMIDEGLVKNPDEPEPA